MNQLAPLPLRITPRLALRLLGRAIFITVVTIAELAAIAGFIGTVGLIGRLAKGGF